MESIRKSVRFALAATSPRVLSIIAAIAALGLLPASASAAEGENVVLSFSKNQQGLIWACFAIGLVTLFYGLFRLRTFVLKQSPGDERMQSVGLAIKEGAKAYLRRQVTTMVPLVVLLALGLVGLYWRLGPTTAAGVGLCFVFGVSASYISGYTGMMIAVEGNMRTANAALSGFRRSLIVAFRSGAVAGTVTVGIGLMGASLIVALFPAIATNLLVGFAFGASLAALFMRVGGGIFTKAADVGADLVGKVEAGIPEDDPRNPAVIADNVGDNVGDCAGMAADVFESYEVTLIAAIVLGAATASVFDAQTWPRLIVFGLAVAAIGLLASIIGIELVNSSDDADADPLKSLKRGFWIAIGSTLVGVGALSALTMKDVSTARLKSVAAYQQEDARFLKGIQADIAAKTKKKPFEVTAKDVLNDPRAAERHFTPDDETQVTTLLIRQTIPDGAIPDLGDYQPVDFKSNNEVLGYSVQQVPDLTQPSSPMMTKYEKISDAFAPGKDYVFARLHVAATVPAQPGGPGVPAQKERRIDQKRWVGPFQRKEFEEQVKNLKMMALQQDKASVVEAIETVPAKLYASPDGKLALVVDANVDQPYSLGGGRTPSTFYPVSPSVLETPPVGSMPPPSQPIDLAVLERTPVQWWQFFLCVGFGMLLAFMIEFITDHFVSTHKRPTQEVAGVATAGAAPMVIQGFAHALTSAVYMALAIGVGLLFPLIVFSPSTYGGYTLSFYGIALVGIGLLTTTGFVLAMDTFGPISDNAQGVFEMSGVGHESEAGAHIVARLDAAGNTTKALTKGFAIATAVVAAVALFHSYLEGAQLNTVGLRLDVPEIFLGMLIGAAAPFLFSAFAIDAVGRASFDLIAEVRRQFREDKGIMAGTSKPDYARCVAIVTKAAQKELLAPGVLAIALPIAVGFGFSIGKPAVDVGHGSFVLTGAQALGGFLAGAIASGQLLAVLLANAGGMWDNAKKLIEDGLHGGKGTEAHKAAVVGDTIGDPFKDTAGPALNPLIKVMNLVAVLISGVIIQPLSPAISVTVTVVCLVALIVSIALAKKGSMSDALQAAAGEAANSDAHFSSNAIAAPTSAAAPATDKKKLFVDDDL